MRYLGSSTIAAALAAVVACTQSGLAQDPALPPPPPALPTKDLPDEQLAAGVIQGHALGLPSPPELLYILSKEGSPKWRQLYHPVLRGPESDRTKSALRLGLSIAEAHLATMARDAQKIRDVTADLQRYAKVLGISDGLAESSRTINHLAEAKAWASVAYELEALVTQTSDVLKTQRDADLANLITTGLWVRLLHVSSSVVKQKDFADTTLAISSPWTLKQIVASNSESEDRCVTTICEQLSKLQRLWAPEKLARGHRFDDALIEESRKRLTAIIHLFTQ